MSDSIEMVTVYKGRDEATYLLEDFIELGENATPLRQRLHPSTKDSPFKVLKLKEIDGIRRFAEASPTKETTQEKAE